MTDVYEKYHSELNKEHIFKIVTDILNNDYGIVLNDISTSKEDFQKSLIQTFSSKQSDDLVTLNKTLIDEFIKHARENYKKTDVDNKLNQLLQERETLFNRLSTSQPINQPINQPNNQPNNQPKNNKNDSSNTDTDEEQSINEQLFKTKQLPVVTINSSKRSNISSSRFCYTYDLQKHSIESKNLQKLSKIMIPYEDVYIFSHAVILVLLKELDITIHLHKTDTIENKGRIYGIYESVDNHILPIKDIQKLTIDIRDISETKYTNFDIIKINKLIIKDNRVTFTCSQFQPIDYQVGDMIKLININSRKYKRLFTYPLKITEIQENCISCNLEDEYKNVTDEGIDMKMLNISNQNIVYFNS